MDEVPVDDVNLHDVPIGALQPKTRKKLGHMLKERKLTPVDPDKYRRDYRGIAALLGVNIMYWAPKKEDYIADLLKNSSKTLGDLQKFLELMDRFDVLDDCRELLYEDAAEFFKQKNSPLRWPNEEKLLTIDDIMDSEKKYDVFLLYVEDDLEFATKIVTTLESPSYNLKVCLKDRLLGGDVFEHKSIRKLISERCRRMIVLLSDEFLESDKDTFFVEFARHEKLDQVNANRFVLPITYKPCKTLPNDYSIYRTLHFERANRFGNLWDTLYISIKEQSVPIDESPIPTPEAIPEAVLEEIPEATLEVIPEPPSKSETDNPSSKKDSRGRKLLKSMAKYSFLDKKKKKKKSRENVQVPC